MAGISHGLPRAASRSSASAKWLARTVPLYVAAIAGAEVVTAFGGTTAGAICHAAVLLVLVDHYVLTGADPEPEDRAPGEAGVASALPALALVPLLRIISLTTPVGDVSRIWWYALAGAPLLCGALLTQRLLGLRARDLGLPPRSWPPQLLIALAGVPLGLAAYAIADPEPIVSGSRVPELAGGSLLLIVFSGFTEELVFRGLVQRSLVATLGPLPGLSLASVTFAATYLGTHSAGYVALVAAVGLAFGICVHRTGSLAGVGLAHGLLSAGAVVVWPAVLG
jgi:uncharacterized protein